MAKEPKNLEDLFHDTLKDIYYAEKKILSSAAENGESSAESRSEGCLQEAPRRDRKAG